MKRKYLLGVLLVLSILIFIPKSTIGYENTDYLLCNQWVQYGVDINIGDNLTWSFETYDEEFTVRAVIHGAFDTILISEGYESDSGNWIAPFSNHIWIQFVNIDTDYLARTGFIDTYFEVNIDPNSEIFEYDPVMDVHTEYLIGETPIHVADVFYLRLGYWDNRIREIYMRFNITSIENITSMKLRLRQEGTSILNLTDYEIRLSLVDNNWSVYATDMWWDYRPEELGYSIIDTMTVDGMNFTDVIFDITELKDGLNDTLFSIFLAPNDLSQTPNFFYQPCSSEYSYNILARPKLIVKYGEPEEPPEHDLPSSFILDSNANNPDIDGVFLLYWTDSEYANNYSIYQNDVLLNSGLTELYYLMENYLNGSYDYKVIAFNNYGNTN